MKLFETLCNRDSMPIFALFSGGNHSHVSTQPNEIAKLEKHFPDTAAAIHALEAEVKAVKKHCVWGTRPPRSKPFNADQLTFMPLCAACPANSIGEV